MYPKEEGFFMPAEWEKREKTFMEWPCREEIWFDGILEAKQGYANIAKAISKFEPVVMIVNKADKEEAEKMCDNEIEILVIEHDDSWIRDNGPTFIKNNNGELRGINWKFNSWGEKYLPYDKDNQVAKKLLEYYGVKSYDAPFVLEGGSIHVDGEGTLLTTEECLLNKNRNPHLKKENIEDYLNKYLSVEKFIWLKRGLFGDETDGHVDNVACFAKPGVVVLQVCYDKNDPNYEITQENLEILRNFIDAKGRKLEIIEIEQPPARYINGERLTLSYLNYYPVNGGIILPTFGGDAKKYDLKAKEILEKIYPDRKVVMVDGMPIIKGGGNVHCITQQMPKGVIK